MLMKLTPGVNFINIFKQLFHTKVFFKVFLCLQFGFVFFWQKNSGAKVAHKMLVKLTVGRWNLTGKYCRRSQTGIIFSSGPYMKLRFKTDGSVVKQGFVATAASGEQSLLKTIGAGAPIQNLNYIILI